MYSLVYMTKNCYSAAMTSIVDNGIMTKSETGMIAAMFYLIYAPFQIVGGIFADKFSPIKLILFGTAGAGVCNLLVYFMADNYIAMLIIWSLNAIIQFGIWPSVFKIVVTEISPKHRMLGVFFINFSPTVGLVVSYVSAVFIDEWENNFLLSAIVLFALTLIIAVIYGTLSKSMIAAADTDAVHRESKSKKAPRELVWLVIASGVPMLLIVYVVQGIMNAGLKAIVPVMLLESYDAVTPSIGNLLNTALIILSPIGLLLGGLPIFKKVSYPAAIAILFAVCIPLVFVLTFIGSANLFVILFALAVITSAMSAATVFFSYATKFFEKYGISGTISGIFNCMAAIALFLSNYVFMDVAEQQGWGVTTKIWLIIAIIALTLAIVSIFLWKRFVKKTESTAE